MSKTMSKAKTVYLAVTPDRYEHVLAMAATTPDLARMMGVCKSGISKRLSGVCSNSLEGLARKMLHPINNHESFFVRSVVIDDTC